MQYRKINNIYNWVSILVLMDLSFRPGAGGAVSTNPIVSILVLMDLSFRQYEAMDTQRNKYSFHPCFNGFVF